MENVQGIFAKNYDSYVADKLIENMAASQEHKYAPELKQIKEKDIESHPTKEEMLLANDSYLDKIGLVDHHKSSINDFYRHGVSQIITDVFGLDKDISDVRESSEIERINLVVKFTDVDWSKLYYTNNMAMEAQLNPIDAEAMNLTYSASLFISVKVIATAYYRNGTKKIREADIKRKKICHAPVMVGSILCNTYMKTREELSKLHEDPSSLGGDLIVRGVPWTICNVENITYNQPRYFLNFYGKEIARCELISKPGDDYQNSDQIILRLNNDNGITLEIRRDKLKDVEFPFYVVFRLLGWTKDIDIYDNINLDSNMNETIAKAFATKYEEFKGANHVYDSMDMLKFVAVKLHKQAFEYLKDLPTDEQQMQQATKSILRWFDKHFLPGLGIEETDRHNKLRYFGLLINGLIKCADGSIESTDRDSCKNKRIHPSGISYAKVFKTYFNAAIVQTMLKKYVKDFKGIPFDKVDLASIIHSNIYGQDFEQLITQTITSGNKSQLRISSQRTITNRLSSQQLSRKNQLMTTALLRQITAPNTDNSKSSERAALMRRVHPSYCGYICLIHSPEGEKVGLNKQIALHCKITSASNSELLIKYVLAHSEVIPLTEVVPERIRVEKLRSIMVNGKWIGCCRSACLLAKKFREMRRKAIVVDGHTIDRYVTIHWEETTDVLHFWADPGRMVRPLFVVYNNKKSPELFEKPYRSPEVIRKSLPKGVKGGNRPKNDVDLIYDAMDRGKRRPENEFEHSGPIQGGMHLKNTGNMHIKKIGEHKEYKTFNKLMDVAGGHGDVEVEKPATDGTERFDDKEFLSELIGIDVDNFPQEYRQFIGYRSEHAKLIMEKKIDIDDLVNAGIIEFISAEEQENMLLAPSIDTLALLSSDERFPFTHCDVPQSLIGITAATAPFAHMNQTPRVTFQCNQAKSTCGYFALNYPYRIEKDVFLQYQCELPLVKTIASKYIFPNGCNAIVAILCQTGYKLIVSVSVKALASPRITGNTIQLREVPI